MRFTWIIRYASRITREFKAPMYYDSGSSNNNQMYGGASHPNDCVVHAKEFQIFPAS